MEEMLFPDTASETANEAAPAPVTAPETAASEEKQPELSFEEALNRLEALVRKMETGQMPLEKLISAYEEGGKLAKVCRARLDRLERKIQILTGAADDAPQWEDFKG